MPVRTRNRRHSLGQLELDLALWTPDRPAPVAPPAEPAASDPRHDRARQPERGDDRGPDTSTPPPTPGRRRDRHAALQALGRIPHGPLALARNNLRVLATLERVSRTPGPVGDDDWEVLLQWAGWGPMARALDPRVGEPSWRVLGEELRGLLTPEQGSAAELATATSFYTAPLVADLVWRLLAGLAFDGGRVLEPGCGNGRFVATAPDGLQIAWTGVERDPTSARIASLLWPDQTVHAGALERVSLPPASFDAAVGNVPFADAKPHDPAAPPLSLHNYCIWRAVQAVRPGGLVVVVTSRYTLDAEHRDAREQLAEDAALVGAVRLPTGVFGGEGTDVVGDVLVLRRRTGEEPAEPAWRHSLPQAALRTAVSEYFLANPQQVVGRMQPRGGARYGHTLEVRFDGDRAALQRALDAAAERLVADARCRGLGFVARPAFAPAEDDRVELAGAHGRKEGSFQLVNGLVYRVSAGRLERVARVGAELRALVGLRDALLELLRAEADQGVPDEALAPLRARLDQRYDRYVAAYGPLNRSTLVQGPADLETGLPTFARRRPQMGGFRVDPDYPTVLALEDVDEHSGVAGKAAIFTRRVNRPYQRPDHAATPAEAVALCLDERGRLDLPTIARLLGIGVPEAPAALGGLAYVDPPTGEWVTAADYLSGDVRAKLDAARAAAAADPDRWARNVTALAAVQPAELGPSEISVKLGAPWVPAGDVQAFLADTLGDGVEVRHQPLVATWEVRAPWGGREGAAASAQWGTGRVDAYRLAETALNGGAPVVYDEVERDDHTTVRVRNAQETLLAESKLQALNERFAQWLWEDPGRADRLCAVYNRRYNATVLRRFDGSHLSFPGLADGFVPYQSQRDIAYRVASTPAALCGYAVGGGKTAAMYLSAMTLRRLGLARKPMIVVPNHLLEQVARDGKRLFPAASILMVTSHDLTRERRKRFAAKCALGDWDAVVITHSAFTSLPVHPSTEADWLAVQIGRFRQVAMAATPDGEQPSRTIKQIAKQADRLEARQRELLRHPVDDGVTFEQLGVDFLLVDEAHYFKNLHFPCRMEGFSVPASKRAADLAMKLWWLRQRNPGGRCGALFTGTPISNSLAELFTVMTYLMPERLAGLGIDSFDAWAGLFVEFTTQVEVAPDGGSFRLHRRPSRFTNLPELRRLLGEVADIRTRDVLGLPGPTPQPDTVVVDACPELQDVVAGLVERADRIRSGGLDRHDDNMLAVCTDGRKAALDLELVGVACKHPGKVGAVVDRVARIWRQTGEELADGGWGLQIVFCDLGTPAADGHDQVYGKLRDGLVAAGLPAAAVRFVHEATTDQAKAELFAGCRAGRVAVLLGSTDKLGVGTNIQDRCVAVHHVDAPWRPADVEQREGRALRPGNRFDRVQVVRYVTEGSFDAYMWQALERKARFVSQILTGEQVAREVADISDTTLSYAEVKALATGNPLLLEHAEASGELRRLRSLATGHTRTQRRLRQEARELAERADADERHAHDLDAVAAHAGAHDPLFVADGHTALAEPADIATALAAAATVALEGGSGSRQHAGRWRGLHVTVGAAGAFTGTTLEVTVRTGSGHSTRFEARPSWTRPGQQWRLFAALDSAVAGAAERAAALRGQAADRRARAAEAEQLLDRPFEHAGALAAAHARLERIDAAIHDQAERPGQPAVAVAAGA